MKPCTGLLVLFMVVISLRPGKSYNLTMVCKDEIVSQGSPFACGQPHCVQYCAKTYFEGWGKCKDDDRFVCECFHICDKDINVTSTIQTDLNDSLPPRPSRVRDPK